MFRNQFFCIAAFTALLFNFCKATFNESICYPMIFSMKKVMPHSYNGLKCNDAFKSKYSFIRKNALCMLPRETVIKLEAEHKDISYIPESVVVKRCSGSCSEPLSCIAPEDAKVIHEIPILVKLRGARGYKCGVVHVEEHLRCTCDCSTVPSACNSMQMYNVSTCKCDCMDQDAIEECRIHNRYWDEQNCRCLCSPMQCSTPLMWVPDMCKCMRVMESETENEG